MIDNEILNSILLSIKKILGIDRDACEFDEDIILAINSTFNILNQLGVGVNGFSISNSSATWTDFLGQNKNVEMVKNYVGLKVGMMFDPPQSSAISEVKKQLISELEWRLNVAVDTIKEEINE